jgi:hypothetical protein
VVLGPVRVAGRVRSFDLPPIDVPVGAIFGETIELAGLNFESPGSDLHSGDDVVVTLVWRALAPEDNDYTVTAQLLGPDGQVYGQQDEAPLGGYAPTSTWSPEEVLEDSYRLAVASDAPPGEYELIVALYLLETGERLPVQGGDNAVILGRLEVTP